MVKTRHIVLISAAMLAVLFLAGCATYSATSASCAFVAGNGRESSDTKFHRIIYPGQILRVTANEVVTYIPCNSRNYIINDGTEKNANNEVVGDRGTLIIATTKTGVTILIKARAFWTPNQSAKAMEHFYSVCFKYQCASPKDVSGDANFSTKGWNGMLAENFGPSLDVAAKKAAIRVDDSIWQRHDPAQYQALADAMSAAFADVVRATLGYPEDLFCGSGNSRWANPDKPGEGEFTCTPVRIQVDEVKRGQMLADDSSQGAIAINKQRLENAQALYGEDAGYWLGLQDSIDKCAAARTTCIINIGGTGGSAAVVVPVNNPAPVPEPTATPKK